MGLNSRCVESGWTFSKNLPLTPTSHKPFRPTSSLTKIRYLAAFFAVSDFLHFAETWVSTRHTMPRRKAAERDLPHKRRSRNGCLNCRRRKIRCDEGTPSCSYCVARSLTCSPVGVVLKWEAEYANNGLAFGRQGVGPTASLWDSPTLCIRHADNCRRDGAKMETRSQTIHIWTLLKPSGCRYRPWRRAILSTTIAVNTRIKRLLLYYVLRTISRNMDRLCP